MPDKSELKGKLELLMFQTTSFCNIACKYCYLADTNTKKRISIDTIRKTIENLLFDNLIGSVLNIVWHFGEPLTVPVSYYIEIHNVIAEILPSNISVNYFFQTNATLIDHEWCSFFKSFNTNICVSIDGPQFVNDFNRTDRNNNSTYAKAYRGINLLTQNNIRFTAISVISNNSLQYYKELYDFFSELNIVKWGINFEQKLGSNLVSSLYTETTNEQEDINIHEFLKNIFNYHIKANKKVKIREFAIAKSNLLNLPVDYYFKNENLSQLIYPFKIVSVDAMGNFSTFTPDLIDQKHHGYGDFLLGNVQEIGFIESTETDKFKFMYSTIMEGIEVCKANCKYFFVCGGGCPASKYSEHRTFNTSDTKFCTYTRKYPFDIILNELENALTIEIEKQTHHAFLT